MAVERAPRSAASTEHVWPPSELLREHAPLVRLLASIWTIPQALKIGLTLGPRSVDLWVFTSEESEEVEASISAAERAYRASTTTSGFMIHVIPEGAVPADALPPYDTLIER